MVNAYLVIKLIAWIFRSIFQIFWAPIEFVYCVNESFPHRTAEQLQKTIGICLRFIVFIFVLCGIIISAL